MEPVSALGIAAAVVQFADFGYRVVKGTYDAYKSSSSRAVGNIKPTTASHDLSQLLQNAEAKLENRWPGQGTPSSPTNDAGSPEDIFRRLCCECREIKSALDEIFAKLVPRGRSRATMAASSLAVELKRVSRAGEVGRLAERLNRVRQQTMAAILVLLLGEAKESGVDIRQFAQQQVDIMDKLDRIDEVTRNFSEDVVNFIGARPSRRDPSGVSKMVRYVLSDRWNAKDYLDRTQSVQHIAMKESVYVANVRKVLQSLFFSSMGHREGQIPQQYAKTFEWIFKQPRQSSDGHPLWHNFSAWLEGDSSQIYWITGKPGAGKSTLVKFIAHDERLQCSLNRWARGARLLIGHYFSWIAGAHKLQKSHEGLLRTLLFEILQQDNSLVPRIFPGRWFLLEIFDGEVDLPQPQFDELLVAFRTLLSETAETLRLALIIDGLDEFEDDHRTLVGLLREANEKPWVKICTSSRPWNVFKDEYIHNPTLQLEKLTHKDIALYLRERFQRSLGFQEFEATNPSMASSIVNAIVERAEGVFLWASVVSGLLEESFQEGHNPADLRATIDGLPGEVSQLFAYIWDRIQLRFLAEASRYFDLMAVCHNLNLTPYSLTFWLGSEEDVADDDVANMTGEYLSKAVASLARRLVSRTGGLLEIFGPPAEPEASRVGYMHRTASDWVRDNWASTTFATKEGFDPTLWVLRGESLRLARSIHSGATVSWGDIAYVFEKAAYVKDTPSNRAALAHILDQLDEHSSKASSLSIQDYPENIAFGPFLQPLPDKPYYKLPLRLELIELILQHGLCAHNIKKTRDMVGMVIARLLDRYALRLEGSAGVAHEEAPRRKESAAVAHEEAPRRKESATVKSRGRRLLLQLKNLIHI
ncbi:hypothetical protein DL765_009520 [Monosporascus sp. GIB2]|nr:hypothetical protein DL765_009520 [Monosporascus sp. GIB2]